MAGECPRVKLKRRRADWRCLGDAIFYYSLAPWVVLFNQGSIVLAGKPPFKSGRKSWAADD